MSSAGHATPVTPGAPQAGQQAPDLCLDDQHGQQVRLSELAGGRSVLLAFYPFAFSGTCTNEMGQIQDQLDAFQNERLQVLGVSCDPMYTLRAWADAEGLGFPLLSDFWPHGAAARAYGVLDESRGMAVRGTFLVGTDGRVRWSQVNGPGERRDFRAVHAAVEDLV